MKSRLKVNSVGSVHTIQNKQRFHFSDVHDIVTQHHEHKAKPRLYGTIKHCAELHVLPYFSNLFIKIIGVTFKKNPD